MGIKKPPIYLFSKTPHPGVTHIPLLVTRHFFPAIDFSAYDLIIATSKEVFVSLEAMQPEWKAIPFLCISEATAKAAKDAGVRVADAAEGYGTSIEERVLQQHGREKILYLRAKVVASDFALSLRSAGVALDEAVVYETSCNAEVLGESIEEDAVLIFTSPSAVECFLSKQTLLPTQHLIAIGETTRAALPAKREVFMPERPSVALSVALAKKLIIGE